MDEAIRSLKLKSIASNEAEFLYADEGCARTRPRSLKRYIHMKQDLVDNIEGPFLHTKHSWASLINSSASDTLREGEYPQLPGDESRPIVEARLEQLETITGTKPSSAATWLDRIQTLARICSQIKRSYSLSDELFPSHEFASSHLECLKRIREIEQFIHIIEYKFPLIYATEFAG